MPYYRTDEQLYTCGLFSKTPVVSEGNTLVHSETALHTGCGFLGFFRTPASEVCPVGALIKKDESGPSGCDDPKGKIECSLNDSTHMCVTHLNDKPVEVHEMMCTDHGRANIVSINGTPLATLCEAFQ